MTGMHLDKRAGRNALSVVCRTVPVLAALLLCLGSFVPSVSSADKDVIVSARDQAVPEIERLNSDALGLFHKKKVGDAVAVWKRAEELAERKAPGSSVHLDVLCNLGLAYFTAGSNNYPLVKKYLERVIEIDPNRWIAYLILGDMCYENFELDCAVVNYDLSLRLDPEHRHAQRVTQRIDALNAKNKGIGDVEAASPSSRRKFILPVSIESELPAFLFYMTINEETFLSRIDIMRENESTVHETIKYEPGGMECYLPANISYLSGTRDLNGDGYNDVKIACSSGREGGFNYLYYLYHRKKSIFIPFTGAALPDQAPGQGSEEIRLYGRTAKGQKPYAETIYKFSRGKLVMVKKAETDGAAQEATPQK